MNQHEPEAYYFISYAQEDQEIVRTLKRDLEAQGFQVWVAGRLPGGTNFRDEIEERIKQSIAVLYLASPASRRSDYVAHEIDLAKIYKRRIIPLWIEGESEWARVAAFGYSNKVYTDLRAQRYEAGIKRLTQTLTHLSDSEADFTSYLNDDDNDRRLQEVNDTQSPLPTHQEFGKETAMAENINKPPVTQEKLRNPVVSPSYRSRDRLNPYKGLYAFEYDDARSFFGRENLIHTMIQEVKKILSEERQNVQAPRCILVKGASGSGKSSAVMAGLLPALEDQQNIPQISRWFFLEPVRPGVTPMKALADALKLPFLNRKNAGRSPLESWHRAALHETIAEPGLHGLSALLQEITERSDERIVLIVDEFEEIFAPDVHAEEREQFIKLLMATATEPDTPLLLVFTLRADFSHYILDNETLYRNLSQHQIEIPPMTREGLRAVIEKPVQPLNITFDPYLAEDLLYEVRQHPESLPLLQFTLAQLFEDRDGQRLTRQSYNRLGELRGAINQHAEYIYDHKLPTAEHQAEARKLFTEYFIYIPESYTEASRLESGEGITRRRVTRADLQLNDARPDTRSETIDAFVKARLLTVNQRGDPEKENAQTITYEISHEALINAWKRLREWIEEDRKDIYLLQSLRPQIRQWSQEKPPKKKKELLVEKSSLQQLQEYSQHKKLDPSASLFLKASLRKQYRQRILTITSSLSIVALIILAFVLRPFIYNLISPDPTIVTSSAASGPGTLMDALQKTRAGGTITFDVAGLGGQPICLPNPFLDINKSITIHGPENPDSIHISSCDTANYVNIGPKGNVTIENVMFTNNYTRKHSIIENKGSLTINNSFISNNKSYGYGGTIHNNGILTLNGDFINDNKVSTNGGAVYTLFGSVYINNSTISGNEAYSNGGGIYSQGGVVTVSGGSYITNNSADDDAGGGIDIVGGSLNMSNTQVKGNDANTSGGKGVGGGIAIQGSVAFITTSIITKNTASGKGGGIVVTEDTDSSASSLLTLQGIIRTDNQNAIYYIGQNSGGDNSDKDIAGEPFTANTSLQVFDDTSIDVLGDPPASYPVQKLPNYLGVANINTFCLNKGHSYGKISTSVDSNAQDIMFRCFDKHNQAVRPDFSGKAICLSQYPTGSGVRSVIDRMANYFDPTSLQCYKNLINRGPIGEPGFANYCKNQPQSSYTGLFDDDRQTAYDWLCQPEAKNKLPGGLAVTDACNMQYHIKNAIDRLANFNSINGWECWAPA